MTHIRLISKYKDFIVEIIDDLNYTLKSRDNASNYDKVYSDAGGFQPTSKHGIRLHRNGSEYASAIICEAGSATGIHKDSFVIHEDHLLICCSDKVYSLQLPDLTLNWSNRFDMATCFAIHRFRNDFIVHGEVEVKRIDVNGNIKWNFSAKDIFVVPDGADALKIDADKIELTDWAGNKYLLDEKGRVIK